MSSFEDIWQHEMSLHHTATTELRNANDHLRLFWWDQTVTIKVCRSNAFRNGCAQPLSAADFLTTASWPRSQVLPHTNSIKFMVKKIVCYDGHS
jgi:hypothetical protein